MRRFGIVILVLLLAVASGFAFLLRPRPATDLPLPREPGNWLVTDADSCRRRYADAPVIRKPVIAWKYQVGSNVNLSEPVVYGDQYIVFGASNGKVTLLDSSGHRHWSRSVAHSLELDDLQIPCPAFTWNGKILADNCNQSIFAFDINGQHLETYTCLGPGEYNVIRDPTGWLKVKPSIPTGMAEDNIVLFAFDGNCIFQGEVYDFTIDEHLNFHYITMNSELCFGNLSSVEVHRSRPYWGLNMNRSVATDRGVLLSNASGSYGIFNYDGTGSSPFNLDEPDNVILSSTVGNQGTIYLSTRKSVINTDSETGIFWRKTFDQELDRTLTLVNDGYLLVTDFKTTVYCLQTGNGKVIWSIRLIDVSAVSRLSVACDGTIYVSVWDHGVFAIRDADAPAPAFTVPARPETDTEAPADLPVNPLDQPNVATLPLPSNDG